MSEEESQLPLRLEPYVNMTEVNQPLQVAGGPLRLIGGDETTAIDEPLLLKWVPSVGVEFEGATSGFWPDPNRNDWVVEFGVAPTRSAPCALAGWTLNPSGTHIRGVVKGVLTLGDEPFDTLRFSIVNGPSYLGSGVRMVGPTSGWFRARLECTSHLGTLRLDQLEHIKDLRDAARAQKGFAVTHVGEWVPASGQLSNHSADQVLRMLYQWFGFLNGSWCGPVLAEGLVNRQVVWRQFARWKLTEGGSAGTWLPSRTPINLQDVFAGYVARWTEPTWQKPLVTAIGWLVEANSSRSVESRIVLAQVALELLAWVWLVEAQRLHSRSDFERLSAAGKIRAVLHHGRVPTAVPDHLGALAPLVQGDAFDGPGVITLIRNSLVHAHEKNRDRIATLTVQQLQQSADLSVQYVELILLAVFGYRAHYARRGWKGWGGDDETLVPWAL